MKRIPYEVIFAVIALILIVVNGSFHNLGTQILAVVGCFFASIAYINAYFRQVPHTILPFFMWVFNFVLQIAMLCVSLKHQ